MSTSSQVKYKCDNCYASEDEKKLFMCSGCKRVRYCSVKCQRAEWKTHRTRCKAQAELHKALETDSPIGPFDRLVLPDGISSYELDARLEQWVTFHGRTLMAACLHAVGVLDDFARIRTHVLHLRLWARPSSEHGGQPGRFFRVIDAQALAIADARTRPAPWLESLESLRELREKGEKMEQGSVGATTVECFPLKMQMCPFGSVKRETLRGRTRQDWKDVLMEDILEGRASTRLTV